MATKDLWCAIDKIKIPEKEPQRGRSISRGLNVLADLATMLPKKEIAKIVQYSLENQDKRDINNALKWISNITVWDNLKDCDT